MKNKIKAFFKKHPGLKIKAKDLAKKLNISSEHEYAELKHILFKLTEEGYLTKLGKRYLLNSSEPQNLVGTLQIVDSGAYGFVILKNIKRNDVFVAGKNLNTAMNGDLVEVKLLEKQRGKNIEGIITKVIERKRNQIVGVLKKSDSFFFVEPDDPTIHRDVYIPQAKLKGAKIGDKVVVGNIVWKSHNLNPEGQVIEVLGKAGLYDTEIASIARELGLKYKFPKKVIKEANSITDTIPEEEIARRVDFRNKNVFTIDPDDAKDFDDALSVEELPNGNYEVGIHIADVSHYIHDDSFLFDEALERGNSVYIVGKVIPMLPERLSNIICSLNPGADRLTYSVIVEMTPNAKIESYEIVKTVINSKRRFTYDEAQEILDTGKGDFKDELLLLNKLAKKLKQKRIRKGSINFFKPEVVFKLDENGKPVDILIKEIKESNNLVEEFMLLANQIVARHVKPSRHKKSDEYPFIYRVHDVPDPDKINEFARFVKSLGYSFDPNAANKPMEFQKLLDAAKGSEEEAVINEVAIRSMAKAVYSTNNIGHYGLGFKYYTHFTSPIRRFADLMVHKLIYDFLKNKKTKFHIDELEEICEHISAKERDALSAERLSVKLKQIEYLKGKLGEEFEGVVSGITNFGIFVELKDTLAEGLIKLRDMEDDYYIFDEKNYLLIGKRTGRSIRLGDKIKVQLIRLDEEKREIDFILID
ncbi:ribonuclease R [Melioribacter roseus P3M-2]|uniref:Ribonuclease R n=1 Tax=Melioribacter roseus (strain DSM 23840 / JCM 17771 / VKM B-2668 / P3M-2) TaxID=1191523 RepID=I7A5D9_MELRP|nr:ribonuclease R [Melioribacter roseus]AFN75106.1 ribonuclease R [Melioribacter roseus P3M-2]